MRLSTSKIEAILESEPSRASGLAHFIASDCGCPSLSAQHRENVADRAACACDRIDYRSQPSVLDDPCRRLRQRLRARGGFRPRADRTRSPNALGNAGSRAFVWRPSWDELQRGKSSPVREDPSWTMEFQREFLRRDRSDCGERIASRISAFQVVGVPVFQCQSFSGCPSLSISQSFS